MNPSSEIEIFYQEGENLRRSGASEDVVIAHLEERLQSLTARLEKETAEKLAEIKAIHAHSSGAVIPKRFRLPVIIAMVSIIVGGILEITIGKQFVFSAANQYRAMRGGPAELDRISVFLSDISAGV